MDTTIALYDIFLVNSCSGRSFAGLVVELCGVDLGTPKRGRQDGDEMVSNLTHGTVSTSDVCVPAMGIRALECPCELW